MVIIGRAMSDRFFRQKSGDRSQESELVLAGIGVLRMRSGFRFAPVLGSVWFESGASPARFDLQPGRSLVRESCRLYFFI